VKKYLSLFLILLLASSLTVMGCSSKQPAGPSPSEEEAANDDLQRFEGQQLNLFVAAGMKKPMDEVIAAFQKASGATVRVNYGPSGGLFAQIEQNQPCDLYYSADWIYIEKLEEAGKLEKSLKFLKDNLVLVVSSGGQAKVKSVQDLTKPDVSLVIADQQAPVGVYAENALRALGLMDKLGDNIKARPSTVNQIAIMVKENQVDAGLIYSSVANANGLEPVETIDEKYSGEIVFGAAVIKGGNTELAEAFMNFARENASVFEKYGWRAYE
jgi:molybdate transport system substrate-binding protein